MYNYIIYTRIYSVAAKFGELTFRACIWQISTSANRLLIARTNLDGFGLANHGQFTKLSAMRYDIMLPLIKLR